MGTGRDAFWESGHEGEVGKLGRSGVVGPTPQASVILGK